MAATRDPQHVGRHDEEKLRRFLAARRAGDEAGARHWWEYLVTDNFDRVRGMVAIASRGHLDTEEQHDALSLALDKLVNRMIHTFRGTSVGEWVESTRRLVSYACMDTQRRAAVISKHERGLEGLDDDAPSDRDVYLALEASRREQESLEEEAQAMRDGRSFLDWAVPQLTDRRREIIELDRLDVSVEEIQRRLGISRDVVYAARSRALKDLVKLRGEYEQL